MTNIDERNLLSLLHGAVSPGLSEGRFGKPDKPEDKEASRTNSAVKDLPVEKTDGGKGLEWVEEIKKTHSHSINDIEVRTDGSLLVSMRAFADPVELNVAMNDIRAAFYGVGAHYRDSIPLYTAELRFSARDNFKRADSNLSVDSQTKK